jgi:hypothetical protein
LRDTNLNHYESQDKPAAPGDVVTKCEQDLMPIER